MGPFCDAPLQQLPQRDVETIRSLANFIQGKKKENEGIVVALAGAERPNFIHNLARLLSMREARTLIVDASFDFAQSQEETNTLWDYLTEKSTAWQTCQCDGFEILRSGSTGRFCVEHLHKERFAQLLIKARAEYDVVLFAYSGIFAANDQDRVLEKMDALIVTVQQETLDQLAGKGFIDRLKQSTSGIIVFQG